MDRSINFHNFCEIYEFSNLEFSREIVSFGIFLRIAEIDFIDVINIDYRNLVASRFKMDAMRVNLKLFEETVGNEEKKETNVYFSSKKEKEKCG